MANTKRQIEYCSHCHCCPAQEDFEQCVWCEDGELCPNKRRRPRRTPKPDPVVVDQLRKELDAVAVATPAATLKTFTCQDCSAEFEGIRARFCLDCRQKRHFVAMSKQVGKRKIYTFTPGMDQVIRDAYEKKLTTNKRLNIKGTLSEEFGISARVIMVRARELGLSRTKEYPWTKEELQLLEKHAAKHDETIATIFRKHGFLRTPTAIHIKIKRTGGKLQHRPYYTKKRLSLLMGVDHHQVDRWIQLGWLKYDHVGSDRTAVQGGDTRIIWPADVYLFIQNHQLDFDLRKVDQEWFLHLVLVQRDDRTAENEFNNIQIPIRPHQLRQADPHERKTMNHRKATRLVAILSARQLAMERASRHA